MLGGGGSGGVEGGRGGIMRMRERGWGSRVMKEEKEKKKDQNIAEGFSMLNSSC